MTYQCSLINDLLGGDHHKRTTRLAGVSHDERCLEAADEIERLRAVIKLARDQDQGAGGGLRPEQILLSMQVILSEAIKYREGP